MAPREETSTKGAPARRLVRRTVIALLVLAVIVFVVFLFVLPPLVAALVRDALRGLGLDDPRLEVVSVRPGRAELADVALGSGDDAAVGRIVVHYGLGDLLAGRVDTVEVENPQLRIDVGPDGVDWRAITPLVERRGEEAPGALPFDRVVVRDGRLLIDLGERVLTVETAGEIRRRGERALDLDVRFGSSGESFALTGGIDLEGRTLDLALKGDVEEVAALVKRAPETLIGRPPMVAGPLAVAATAAGPFDAPRVAVTLSTTGIEARGETPLGNVRFRRISGSVRAAGTSIDDLDGRVALTAEDGNVLGEAVARVDVEAAADGPDLTLAARVNAGDWSIPEITFTGTRAGGDGGVSGAFALGAAGRLPWNARRRLGIEIPVEGAGRGRLDLSGVVRARPAGAGWRVALTDGVLDLVLPALGVARAGLTTGDVALSARAVRGVWSDGSLTLAIGAGTEARAGSLALRQGPLVATGSRDAFFATLVEDAWLRWPARPGTPLLRARGIETTARLDGVVGGGARAGNLEATIDLGVELDTAGRGRLRFAPGTLLRCGDLAPGLSRLVLAAGEAPVFEARVEGEDVLFAFDRDAERAWTLEGARIHLAAAAARLEDRLLRVVADGPRVDLDVSVIATPDDLTASFVVEDGHAAEAGWGGIEVQAAGERVAVGPGTVTLAPHEGASFLYWRHGADGRLEAAVRADSRTDAGFSLSGRESAFAADVALDLELERDADGLAMRADAALADFGGRLVWPITDGEMTATAEGATLQGRFVLEREGPARATFAAGGEQGVIELALRRGRRPDEDDWSGRALLSSLTGEATLGETPTVRARLSFEDGRFRHEGLDLTVREVGADLPILVNVAEDEDATGRLSYAALGLGDDELPGLEGTIALRDGLLVFGGESAILPDARVAIDGRLDFASGLPVGTVTAIMPPFVFDEDNRPGDVFGIAAGADVAGEMGFAARIDIDGRDWTSGLDLTLKDIDVTSLEWNLELVDLDAELKIDDLAGMTTPAHQRLSVARARLGAIELEDGVTRFQIESPTRLFVEKSEWNWAGGRLSTFATLFDRETLEGAFEVFLTDVDLGAFLELVSGGDATGSGRLNGRLAVDVAWPEVAFGKGFLHAAPGQGEIRFQDEKALRDLLGGENLDPIRESAAQALQNLRYTILKADVVREDDDAMAKFQVRGKPADSSSQQEYVVDVNIRGLDRLVNSLIIVQRARRELEESGLSADFGSDPR